MPNAAPNTVITSTTCPAGPSAWRPITSCSIERGASGRPRRKAKYASPRASSAYTPQALRPQWKKVRRMAWPAASAVCPCAANGLEA